MVFPFTPTRGLGTVILVPGITGSELHYPGGIFRSGLVWCAPQRLITGGFTAMRLGVPSEGLAAPITPVSEPGVAMPAYYGSLAAYLTLRGWKVVWPYADWRLPMTVDAAGVLALIRENSDNRPLMVLCHSRGGLLTRLALAGLASAGQLGFVRRVVGLGVPHTGSLDAAAYVSGDSRETKLVRQLELIFPAGVSTSYLIGAITDTTRSWPALYELMPQPGCPWLDPDKAAALYQPGSWSASATTPVSAYLSAAFSNWSALPPVPSGVEWIDVAGTGFPTANDYPSMDDLAQSGSLIVEGDGDGTVLLASAAQAPRKRCLVPTSHSSLPIDPRVWELAHSLLLNGTTTDLSITGRLLDV